MSDNQHPPILVEAPCPECGDNWRPGFTVTVHRDSERGFEVSLAYVRCDMCNGAGTLPARKGER